MERITESCTAKMGLSKLDQSMATQPRETIKRRRRSWRRRATRIVALLTIAYFLGGVGLYFGQGWMMFPGAFIHDRQSATIPAGPDREIISIHDVDGHRVAAVFGA